MHGLSLAKYWGPAPRIDAPADNTYRLTLIKAYPRLINNLKLISITDSQTDLLLLNVTLHARI